MCLSGRFKVSCFETQDILQWVARGAETSTWFTSSTMEALDLAGIKPESACVVSKAGRSANLRSGTGALNPAN